MAEVTTDLDVAEEPKSLLRGNRSKTRDTDLIFGWSGATPRRTSPQGVGSRSNKSTSIGELRAE